MPFAAVVVVALHALPAAASPKGSPAATAGTRQGPPRLSQAEIESVVRMAPMKLPKGATLTGVHVTALPPVPAIHTRLVVDVTPPPRKSGPVAAVALATFYRGDEIVARVPLILDLRIAKEAIVFDVVKGSAVQLVVQRGLVEVTAPAVTSDGADVGDVVQVLLRPSGRALKARLVARDRAVAVEGAAPSSAPEKTDEEDGGS